MTQKLKLQKILLPTLIFIFIQCSSIKASLFGGQQQPALVEGAAQSDVLSAEEMMAKQARDLQLRAQLAAAAQAQAAKAAALGANFVQAGGAVGQPVAAGAAAPSQTFQRPSAAATAIAGGAAAAPAGALAAGAVGAVPQAGPGVPAPVAGAAGQIAPVPAAASGASVLGQSHHLSQDQINALAEAQRQAILNANRNQAPGTTGSVAAGAPAQAVVAGIAPAGASVSSSTGISGEPATAGSANVTVQDVSKVLESEKQGISQQLSSLGVNQLQIQNIQARKIDEALGIQEEKKVVRDQKVTIMGTNRTDITHTNYTQLLLDMTDEEFKRPPPLNGKVVIYNPVFRCASEYIGRMMKRLARMNDYTYDLNADRNSENDHNAFIHYVDSFLGHLTQEDRGKPILFQKMHTIFNLTEFNRPQPTWITLIRNPVNMFSSEWNFCRYGSKIKPKSDPFMCHVPKGSETMSIGQCLRSRHDACMKTKFEWHQYICGTSPECYATRLTGAKSMRKASEVTKNAILRDWFLVGLSDPEYLAITFDVLEVTIPGIFKNGAKYIRMNALKQYIEMSKSNNATSLKQDEYNYLAKGLLRYEMDIYEFIKAVLSRMHKAWDVERKAAESYQAFLQDRESQQDLKSAGADIEQIINDARKDAILRREKQKQAAEDLRLLQLQKAREEEDRRKAIKRKLAQLQEEQELDKQRLERQLQRARIDAEKEKDEKERKLKIEQTKAEEEMKRQKNQLEREMEEEKRRQELAEKRRIAQEEQLAMEKLHQEEVAARRKQLMIEAEEKKAAQMAKMQEELSGVRQEELEKRKERLRERLAADEARKMLEDMRRDEVKKAKDDLRKELMDQMRDAKLEEQQLLAELKEQEEEIKRQEKMGLIEKKKRQKELERLEREKEFEKAQEEARRQKLEDKKRRDAEFEEQQRKMMEAKLEAKLQREKEREEEDIKRQKEKEEREKARQAELDRIAEMKKQREEEMKLEQMSAKDRRKKLEEENLEKAKQREDERRKRDEYLKTLQEERIKKEEERIRRESDLEALKKEKQDREDAKNERLVEIERLKLEREKHVDLMEEERLKRQDEMIKKEAIRVQLEKARASETEKRKGLMAEEKAAAEAARLKVLAEHKKQEMWEKYQLEEKIRMDKEEKRKASQMEQIEREKMLQQAQIERNQREAILIQQREERQRIAAEQLKRQKVLDLAKKRQDEMVAAQKRAEAARAERERLEKKQQEKQAELEKKERYLKRMADEKNRKIIEIQRQKDRIEREKQQAEMKAQREIAEKERAEAREKKRQQMEADMKEKVRYNDKMKLLGKGWEESWIDKYLDNGGKENVKERGITPDQWLSEQKNELDYADPLHDHDVMTDSAEKKTTGDSLAESIKKMNDERAIQMMQMAEAKRKVSNPLKMSNNPAAAIAAMHGMSVNIYQQMFTNNMMQKQQPRMIRQFL